MFCVKLAREKLFNVVYSMEGGGVGVVEGVEGGVGVGGVEG